MPDDAATLHLRVLTPRGPVLEKQVRYVVLRGAGGDLGILPGHQHAAYVLGLGMLRAYEAGKDPADTLFVMGGTAHVEGGSVTVLSEMAGGQQEVEQALQRLETAREERRLEEQRTGLDIQRAEVALRNALVQMDVSAYSVLNNAGGDTGGSDGT